MQFFSANLFLWNWYKNVSNFGAFWVWEFWIWNAKSIYLKDLFLPRVPENILNLWLRWIFPAPSEYIRYQLLIMSHLTTFLLEEPWGEGNLHTRYPGQGAIYTVGVMAFILGWRVWTSAVPRCQSWSSPTRDPIQGWHIPHGLPASVFPSESPKTSVTCSIFMCGQMKLEPDMLYAGRPSVPSLLYIPPLDLTYQTACRWGRREGEGRVSTRGSSVCCYRC